ncbi:hypothetical protein ONZ45_g14124 [Pleurotus djamor]|nr:hypothetical protein ONZ45_g14124 [Pleurotus djamor]
MLKLFVFCVAFLVTFNGATVLSTTGCNCEKKVKGKIVGYEYIESQVRFALQRGRDYQAKGIQVGKNKYPHRFGNREGLVWPQACTAPFQEFPILNDRVFTGKPDTPGAERIVWDVNGNFCGCMTHNGVKGNSFQLC